MKTMKALLIDYQSYDQQDKPVKRGFYRSSFTGELAPQVLKAAINMINTETKASNHYYTIIHIIIDDDEITLRK